MENASRSLRLRNYAKLFWRRGDSRANCLISIAGWAKLLKTSVSPRDRRLSELSSKQAGRQTQRKERDNGPRPGVIQDLDRGHVLQENAFDQDHNISAKLQLGRGK